MTLSDTRPLLGSPTSLHRGTSWTETVFNFAKASLGAGSFALPYAIKCSGILLGPIALVLISVISLYTMNLMLHCKRFVRRYLSEDAECYASIGQAIAPSWGHHAVNYNVIFCNVGVCAGYLIFIGMNFQSAVYSLFYYDFSMWTCYGVILPVVLLLTWLPSFKHLAFGAYLGSIFLVIAMVFTYSSIIFETGLTSLSEISVARLDTFPEFFGISAFLFCIHSMVIPMESQMKNKSQMSSVLTAACAIVIALNLPFAVVGYLAFGEDTKGYVFCNLPHSVVGDLVRLSLCLELVCTYPLIMNPAANIIEEKLLGVSVPFSRANATSKNIWGSRGIRFVTVLASFLLAYMVPAFQKILSLVGGFAAATLAFVLPPVFHLLLSYKYSDKLSLSKTSQILHVVLITVGLAAVVLTTTYNVFDIIESYMDQEALKVARDPQLGTC